MPATRRPVFAVFALLLAPAATAVGQEGDGSKVYKKVVPSVAWVQSRHDAGLATGSGSLIDKDRRLVLTNYHVVGDQPRARVFFPLIRNGLPQQDKKYYLDRQRELGIDGRVVARDRRADLALIQIDEVPPGVPSIPLSATGAEPAQTVHSIGSPGRSDALWGYVKGTVRAVHNKTWRAKLEPGKIATFSARVVETDSPTNPGDSGGPLVNDRGELVGVTQGAAVDAQLLSYFIDVSEVRKLLQSEEVKRLRGGGRAAADDRPAVKKEPKREKSLPIADKADLFSPEAEKKAQEVIGELYAGHKVDVLVETYPAVPEADAERVKAMTPAERGEYMQEWARRRMRDEKVSGFVILITTAPRALRVVRSGDQEKRFPDAFVKTVVDAVTAGLKGDRDAALAEPLKLIRDHLEKK